MPRYFVEHYMPQAGDLIPIDITAMADQCGLVQQDMAPHIRWILSIITTDLILCIYVATEKKIIEEYAQRCGLPIQRITEVVTMFGPTGINP